GELFEPSYIEGVFLTRECAFNSSILKNIMAERVRRADVSIRLRTSVCKVSLSANGLLRVETKGPSECSTIDAGRVFCCTYSQLNAPGAASGMSSIPLKHELTELALIEVPEPIRNLGITVMDGPYFSVMPFPAR